MFRAVLDKGYEEGVSSAAFYFAGAIHWVSAHRRDDGELDVYAEPLPVEGLLDAIRQAPEVLAELALQASSDDEVAA